MKDEMSKLTAEIDRDVYQNIVKVMHHGQMTQLVRAFTLSINQIINSGEKNELYIWLYGGGTLILPPPDEEEERGNK